jgi:DNA-binding NarL/FixJ family response regulator
VRSVCQETWQGSLRRNDNKLISVEKITILLAEDHQVVREGLRALLESNPDFEIVGEANNGRQAVVLARKLMPHIVIMDVAMPELNGLEATKQIVKAMPETRILVLSSYDDPECVEKLIEAGVRGFLSKRSAANQLPDAIRSVRCGKNFFSPEVAKRVQERRNAAAKSRGPSGKPFELTIREAEVLQLIAEGLPNKGIAARLGISIKTVEKHRQSAMDKLNIHEVAGLTRYAMAQGMVGERAKPAHATPVSGETERETETHNRGS